MDESKENAIVDTDDTEVDLLLSPPSPPFPSSSHHCRTEEALEPAGRRERGLSSQSLGRISVIMLMVALVLSNGLFATLWVREGRRDHRAAGSFENAAAGGEVPATIEELPLKPRRLYWNTEWGSSNDTAADLLWNGINTARGYIAVGPELVKEKHWHESMDVPGHQGKHLYLLEAYHQLHCLRIIRRVLLDLAHDIPPTFALQHARHCLDYQRQFVICHADATPLYSRGDHTSGDGQMHMCRDWSALRLYANQNSACFRDHGTGDESVEEQFSHCDDKEDGLEHIEEEKFTVGGGTVNGVVG